MLGDLRVRAGVCGPSLRPGPNHNSERPAHDDLSCVMRCPVMLARIASFTFGIIAPPALVGWLVFLH
jgi:hypothetical protein